MFEPHTTSIATIGAPLVAFFFGWWLVKGVRCWLSSPPMRPDGIGPHEGRELELMLAGEKPLSMPHEDLYEVFDAMVKRGQLRAASVRIRVPTHRSDITGRLFGPTEAKWHELRFYALPSHEDRLQSISAIYEGVSLRFPLLGLTDYEHATIGWLLGYSDGDIAAFLNHIHNLGTRKSKS